MKNIMLTTRLVTGASLIVAMSATAFGADFNIPRGSLASALDAYSAQSGIALVVSASAVKNVQTAGVKGDLSADEALARILKGTGFVANPGSSGVIEIIGNNQKSSNELYSIHMAAASTPTVGGAALETVTVTSSKVGGDVQNIPISITALSQEQLTATQTAGGPDLVKQVPNMTFTKTNFSGYSIQLRGIGTQAISVTTDPAVAVAFNDIPFIRNHFFEQEFYDVSQVEVLRGPQGTLYGRNATAGVVNLVSAKPSDQFEAMASADIGNYENRRLEAMINVPIVDDRLDLRVAGEWTKRQGYTFNESDDQRVDGRDLWSGRMTLGWKPSENIQSYLVWEHFSENDDRLRSGKQLCKTDPDPSEVNGVPLATSYAVAYEPALYLSQGCSPTSFYSKEAFEVPNGITLPYYEPLGLEGVPIPNTTFDPYASTTQSTNLRQIESALLPTYRAKNDTLEWNVDYRVTPALTFSSQTGYNHDFLWSTEDYNRFNTAPGAFTVASGVTTPDPSGLGICYQVYGECSQVGATCRPPGVTNECVAYGVFCDPQLGCSNRLVAEDLDEEQAWQLSQEFRLASNFSGPFNFSVGGNYLHYETQENYYVFFNSLTLASYTWSHGGTSSPTQTLPWVPGVSDNSNCLAGGFAPPNLNEPNKLGTEGETACIYIDPNPISSLNSEGHNYFLSQNPYILNSYAMFGEAYYNIAPDLKLTGGIRWTDDRKHFVDIPSELVVAGYGFSESGVVNQGWERFTGRAVLDWTPKLDFTDQTLVYASYAHGYKAGGANPPGAQLLVFGNTGISTPIHPQTFKPEYIEAFELGTKNTAFDGSLTLNGDVFYYNYTGYQISEIVDRTAINNNYNAHVEGAEVETNWEPIPGLKFNFAGGWEDSAAASGDSGIDLMDRTAGNPNWMVVKPFVTQASNCILPTYVVAALMAANPFQQGTDGVSGACSNAYQYGLDPVTGQPYTGPNPPVGFSFPPGYTGPNPYPGFNPATAPNNGEGFAKNLGGNELPNAPPFTVSFGAQYTLPITPDWAGTLRGDYYWQDYSWARVFNDNPYDRLRGYTNVNLTLIFTNQNGWQVMLYDKNIFDTTAITGDFLNSDDSGLTTNVFLTDPKLIGVRVTKNW
jgi:iron complex outermembrane receptor protein